VRKWKIQRINYIDNLNDIPEEINVHFDGYEEILSVRNNDYLNGFFKERQTSGVLVLYS
jgi:hypothetical protein